MADTHSIFCDICRCSRADDPDNPFIVCDGCSRAVHLTCYGVLDPYVDSWLCYNCTMGGPQQCFMCTRADGRMTKPLYEGNAVHIICALSSELLWFDCTSRMDGIQYNHRKLRENLPHTCCLCKARGTLTIKCCSTGCDTFFHPICAAEAGMRLELRAQWNPSVPAWCPEHQSTLTPPPRPDVFREEHVQGLLDGHGVCNREAWLLTKPKYPTAPVVQGSVKPGAPTGTGTAASAPMGSRYGTRQASAAASARARGGISAHEDDEDEEGEEAGAGAGRGGGDRGPWKDGGLTEESLRMLIKTCLMKQEEHFVTLRQIEDAQEPAAWIRNDGMHEQGKGKRVVSGRYCTEPVGAPPPAHQSVPSYNWNLSVSKRDQIRWYGPEVTTGLLETSRAETVGFERVNYSAEGLEHGEDGLGSVHLYGRYKDLLKLAHQQWAQQALLPPLPYPAYHPPTSHLALHTGAEGVGMDTSKAPGNSAKDLPLLLPASRGVSILSSGSLVSSRPPVTSSGAPVLHANGYGAVWRVDAPYEAMQVPTEASSTVPQLAGEPHITRVSFTLSVTVQASTDVDHTMDGSEKVPAQQDSSLASFLGTRPDASTLNAPVSLVRAVPSNSSAGKRQRVHDGSLLGDGGRDSVQASGHSEDLAFDFPSADQDEDEAAFMDSIVAATGMEGSRPSFVGGGRPVGKHALNWKWGGRAYYQKYTLLRPRLIDPERMKAEKAARAAYAAATASAMREGKSLPLPSPLAQVRNQQGAFGAGGEPPRKRGRPRKHPRLDDYDQIHAAAQRQFTAEASVPGPSLSRTGSSAELPASNDTPANGHPAGIASEQSTRGMKDALSLNFMHPTGVESEQLSFTEGLSDDESRMGAMLPSDHVGTAQAVAALAVPAGNAHHAEVQDDGHSIGASSVGGMAVHPGPGSGMTGIGSSSHSVLGTWATTSMHHLSSTGMTVVSEGGLRGEGDEAYTQAQGGHDGGVLEEQSAEVTPQLMASRLRALASLVQAEVSNVQVLAVAATKATASQGVTVAAGAGDQPKEDAEGHKQTVWTEEEKVRRGRGRPKKAVRMAADEGVQEQPDAEDAAMDGEPRSADAVPSAPHSSVPLPPGRNEASKLKSDLKGTTPLATDRRAQLPTARASSCHQGEDEVSLELWSTETALKRGMQGLEGIRTKVRTGYVARWAADVLEMRVTVERAHFLRLWAILRAPCSTCKSEGMCAHRRMNCVRLLHWCKTAPKPGVLQNVTLDRNLQPKAAPSTASGAATPYAESMNPLDIDADLLLLDKHVYKPTAVHSACRDVGSPLCKVWLKQTWVAWKKRWAGHDLQQPLAFPAHLASAVLTSVRDAVVHHALGRAQAALPEGTSQQQVHAAWKRELQQDQLLAAIQLHQAATDAPVSLGDASSRPAQPSDSAIIRPSPLILDTIKLQAFCTYLVKQNMFTAWQRYQVSLSGGGLWGVEPSSCSTLHGSGVCVGDIGDSLSPAAPFLGQALTPLSNIRGIMIPLAAVFQGSNVGAAPFSRSVQDGSFGAQASGGVHVAVSPLLSVADVTSLPASSQAYLKQRASWITHLLQASSSKVHKTLLEALASWSRSDSHTVGAPASSSAAMADTLIPARESGNSGMACGIALLQYLCSTLQQRIRISTTSGITQATPSVLNAMACGVLDLPPAFSHAAALGGVYRPLHQGGSGAGSDAVTPTAALPRISAKQGLAPVLSVEIPMLVEQYWRDLSTALGLPVSFTAPAATSTRTVAENKAEHAAEIPPSSASASSSTVPSAAAITAIVDGREGRRRQAKPPSRYREGEDEGSSPMPEAADAPVPAEHGGTGAPLQSAPTPSFATKTVRQVGKQACAEEEQSSSVGGMSRRRQVGPPARYRGDDDSTEHAGQAAPAPAAAGPQIPTDPHVAAPQPVVPPAAAAAVLLDPIPASAPELNAMENRAMLQDVLLCVEYLVSKTEAAAAGANDACLGIGITSADLTSLLPISPLTGCTVTTPYTPVLALQREAAQVPALLTSSSAGVQMPATGAGAGISSKVQVKQQINAGADVEEQVVMEGEEAEVEGEGDAKPARKKHRTADQRALEEEEAALDELRLMSESVLTIPILDPIAKGDTSAKTMIAIDKGMQAWHKYFQAKRQQRLESQQVNDASGDSGFIHFSVTGLPIDYAQQRVSDLIEAYPTHTGQAPATCVCGKHSAGAADDESLYVGCDVCRRWVHTQCAGLSRFALNYWMLSYVCAACIASFDAKKGAQAAVSGDGESEPVVWVRSGEDPFMRDACMALAALELTQEQVKAYCTPTVQHAGTHCADCSPCSFSSTTAADASGPNVAVGESSANTGFKVRVRPLRLLAEMHAPKPVPLSTAGQAMARGIARSYVLVESGGKKGVRTSITVEPSSRVTRKAAPTVSYADLAKGRTNDSVGGSAPGTEPHLSSAAQLPHAAVPSSALALHHHDLSMNPLGASDRHGFTPTSNAELTVLHDLECVGRGLVEVAKEMKLRAAIAAEQNLQSAAAEARDSHRVRV